MDAVQTFNKTEIGIYRKCKHSYFNDSKKSSKRFNGGIPYLEVFDLNNDVYWIDKYISFDIHNKTFKINRELSSIKEVIIDSQYILKLTDDWDDNDSLATNIKTYLRAIDFLLDYSTYIFNQFNHIISPPEINIVRDGSIDLEWRNDKCILLINFKKVTAFDVHFYTEDFLNTTIFKGILNRKDLNIDLAHWMKKI